MITKNIFNTQEIDPETEKLLDQIEEELYKDPELKEELEAEEKTARTITSYYKLN